MVILFLFCKKILLNLFYIKLLCFCYFYKYIFFFN